MLLSGASRGHRLLRLVAPLKFTQGTPVTQGTSVTQGTPVTQGTSVLQSLFSSASSHRVSRGSVHCRKYSASAEHTPSYSYVIVGAGSAGCVLANRLSEDPHESVLLLEAGPKDKVLGSTRLSWKIHMPAALTYNLCDDKYNWSYHTEVQAHMDHRVLYWPRGRVWGGSSSLNAMVYIRGHAEDYNRWHREGAEGWDYEHCLPYFRKAQSHELGQNRYRGGSGPLKVSRGKTQHPLHKAFIEAGQQAGYPFTDDMNGHQQEGLGWMDMTVYKGMRWSTASAYLRPALDRPNLRAEVRCLTTKILFDGQRAVGVEYIQRGQRKRVFAEKEVILSGGAINSPHLLMLSGVGHADHLAQHGINVVQHLPGVGSNLQDHLELYVQQQCTQPITLYKAQKPFHMVKIGLEWLTMFTGYGATAHLETGGFIRSRPGVTHPDIQFHFLPSQVIDHGRVASKIEAYQVHVGPMRSTSVGWLKLRSANPQDHPILQPNYLSTDEDVWEFRESVKLSREIFGQKAFDPFRGPEVLPGPSIQSDAEIDAFVRRKADSAYHPSCTCKMGAPSDPMAVVDPSTRVLGLDGLRVVDASIMPSIVSGNLNAPTIMMAEKAADIIKGHDPLVDREVPVYQPPTLQTQR
ncbi:choline dehydrogenase, mitochondrial [Eucyclogobius newberryi]|uniref:choline dehydrogenase, mitochondrial n=1 Tax=Eucyclogobius newberryi TaxID=166745 RepID=UPI003B5BC983